MIKVSNAQHAVRLLRQYPKSPSCWAAAYAIEGMMGWEKMVLVADKTASDQYTVEQQAMIESVLAWVNEWKSTSGTANERFMRSRRYRVGLVKHHNMVRAIVSGLLTKRSPAAIDRWAFGAAAILDETQHITSCEDCLLSDRRCSNYTYDRIRIARKINHDIETVSEVIMAEHVWG